MEVATGVMRRTAAIAALQPLSSKNQVVGVLVVGSGGGDSRWCESGKGLPPPDPRVTVTERVQNKVVGIVICVCRNPESESEYTSTPPVALPPLGQSERGQRWRFRYQSGT